MDTLHDMHCHLDYMANGEQVAADAREAGTLLFANTVTPEGWMAANERFAPYDNVIVGFGMHPWFVAPTETPDSPCPRQTVQNSAQACHPERSEGSPRSGLSSSSLRGDSSPSAQNDKTGLSWTIPRKASSQRAEHRRLSLEAERIASDKDQTGEARRRAVVEYLERFNPQFIGEIGLDFGWRHQASKATQIEMLASIVDWAARESGKLISLHSIKAARETIDILERSGTLQTCTCIFHWFSGPSDQLKRAIDAGCYFSCGPRMLATGKGREYVKAIPAGKLLLETDAPPEQGVTFSYAELRAELESAAASIAAIKGEAALETIAQTSVLLLAS